MRVTYAAAAAGMALAVVLIAPPTAQADLSGYRRCVGSVKEVPISEPDPLSIQLARQVEMDLKAGATPDAEAQKVGNMGFDPNLADAVVRCALQNNP